MDLTRHSNRRVSYIAGGTRTAQHYHQKNNKPQSHRLDLFDTVHCTIVGPMLVDTWEFPWRVSRQPPLSYRFCIHRFPLPDEPIAGDSHDQQRDDQHGCLSEQHPGEGDFTQQQERSQGGNRCDDQEHYTAYWETRVSEHSPGGHECDGNRRKG